MSEVTMGRNKIMPTGTKYECYVLGKCHSPNTVRAVTKVSSDWASYSKASHTSIPKNYYNTLILCIIHIYKSINHDGW
jgi:hypothetical protein